VCDGRHNFTAKEYEAMGIASTRIPCPAGTLIIFDACLPHGTMPNRSDRPRAIQFLRYIPAEVFSKENLRSRCAAVRRHCARVGFEPSAHEQEDVLY
jgi:ectoine hydroxylase-related dioxygenase (phytanoyl-CoA dioxygenase family)